MKPILEIKNVSKKFRIQSGHGPYLNIRDTIISKFGFGNQSGSTRWGRTKTKTEDFYALTDVSFDVNAGDAIGIIGNNGAGKSTLLKVISKITPPTSGKIIVRGRVASLLEVGTGFHAELTGRENIFLNGSILGMKRREIFSKFDEIVDFSGVEKFIETPIKHYSSGMQLRLAFAVAAFLEPEILLIDEVLAVGDAEFQKKCLGKMDEVHRSGRTVLFVSHNMGAVNGLCTKGVFLDQGKVKAIGEPVETITQQYLQSGSSHRTRVSWKQEDEPPSDDYVSLLEAGLVDEKGNYIDFARIGNKIGIQIIYKIKEKKHRPVGNIHVRTYMGETAFVCSCSFKEDTYFEKGIYKTTMWIPDNFLNGGNYYISLGLTTIVPSTIVHCFEQDLFSIDVVDDSNALTRNGFKGSMPGAVRPLLDWSTEVLEKATYK